MVAVRFKASGVQDQTGVWAKNGDLAEPGLILSVDGMAKEFTDWPDGSTTDAQLSATDDGVKQARNCVDE